MSLMVASSDGVAVKSQVQDYELRANELEAMNFVDFVVQMYEETCKDQSSHSEPGQSNRGC